MLTEPPLPGLDRLEATTLVVGTATTGVGIVSLTAALLGIWSTPLVFGAIMAISLLGVVSLVRLWPGLTRPPTLVAVCLILILIIGGALTIPGFQIGMAGWDPGVYAMHAQSIVDTGGYDTANQVAVLAHQNDVVSMGFPGLQPSSKSPDRLNFGFFHLYPALAAIGQAVGRSTGLSLVNPFLGLLGISAVSLLVRRLSDSATGLLAGLFLSVSVIWVWHERLSSSEVPSASLFAVGLMAAVVAWDERRSGWMLAAGLSFGVAASARADGLLVLLIASLGLGFLIWNGRRELATAGFVGLVPGAALWVVAAYWTSADYAETHHVPGALLLGAVFVATPALALLLRTKPDRVNRLNSWLSRRQQQLMVISVAAVFVMLTGFLVRDISAPPIDPSNAGSFVPHNLSRLGFFLWPGGVVAVLLGLGGLTHPKAHRLIIVITPGVLVAPLYLYDPRISDRLIWWTRRYVPLMWIPVIVLGALGCVTLYRLLERWQSKPVGVSSAGLLALAMLFPQLMWTAQMRGDRELGGSLDVSAATAAEIPAGTTALWVRGHSFSAFAAPAMVNHGVNVVPVSSEATSTDWKSVLDQLDPGTPVVVVTDTFQELDMDEVVLIDRATIARDLPYLAFTYTSVPTEIGALKYSLTIFDLIRCDDPALVSETTVACDS